MPLCRPPSEGAIISYTFSKTSQTSLDPNQLVCCRRIDQRCNIYRPLYQTTVLGLLFCLFFYLNPYSISRLVIRISCLVVLVWRFRVPPTRRSSPPDLVSLPCQRVPTSATGADVVVQSMHDLNCVTLFVFAPANRFHCSSH